MKLDYDIYHASSYSCTYHPENIKKCHQNGVVTDQSSRWSSSTNNQQQFLILKLNQVAHLQSVTFGKFHKVHVCNLKEFKLYVSHNNKQYIEILHDGLKNDSEPEQFHFNTVIQTTQFPYPCLYIKIQPLLAHGANFNFSIWYLECHGTYLNPQQYQQYLDYHAKLSLQVSLKFLRQHYPSIYDHIHTMPLEHPYLQQFHTLLMQGDFHSLDTHLQSLQLNWFQHYIDNAPYHMAIQPLPAMDLNGKELAPRGGHQMVATPHGIFLHGGWTGANELGDLHVFRNDQWHPLNAHGPCARSCHKMVYHQDGLYIYGRYSDQSGPADMWHYHIPTNKWTLLHEDSSPGLVYDHQMVVVQDTIYMFGGKAGNAYSGFYLYHIPTKQWSFLECPIKSRTSHCMVHVPNKGIYLFGGQHLKEPLLDMHLYDTESQSFSLISKDISKQNGPMQGYTQRCGVDGHLIYVVTGIKDKMGDIENKLSIYDTDQRKWSQMDLDIKGRFAHQLVVQGDLYIMGGNPGYDKRLNDFIRVVLTKPTKEEIMAHLKLQLKIQEYKEIAQQDHLKGLKYLQSLKNLLNQKDYEKLSLHLFNQEDLQKLRETLYDDVIKYFPREMKQPEVDLMDLVPIDLQ